MEKAGSTTDRTVPALIPAAGKGTRLRPITRFLSKPMLPVGSRPLIDFIIEEAARAGCRPIVVVGSPGDHDLRTFVQERAKNKHEDLIWARQTRSLGLAHALCQGYNVLDEPSHVVALLPDNVAPQGNPSLTLLEQQAPPHVLLFGTIEVSREQAPFFGNSGAYQGSSTSEYGPGVEVIDRLQEKGSGTFERQFRQGHTRRTVGRMILPEEFFRRARGADPDPDTGEIDDVPVYRSMIQSSFALGVRLSATVYDMGEPERYLRLCARMYELEKFD